MVMKVAQIGIPILLSRSGVTEMGLSMAQKLNITLIARAKGRHFLIFNGKERVVLDLIDQDASIDQSSA
jgi:FdhD protein